MSRYAILVLGIARSGTSALAGTLNDLGIPFGENLKPIDKQNPKGNFENLPLSKLNQAILNSIGSNWSDYNQLPDDWLNRPEVKKFTDQIETQIADEFDNSKIFGVKDPRLVPLYPVYNTIFKRKGIEPIVITIKRERADTINSIEKSGYFHGEFSHDRGEKLYDYYDRSIQNILQKTFGLRIHFDELLYETEAAIEKIKNHLPLEILSLLEPYPKQNHFLELNLHHFKSKVNHVQNDHDG